MEHVAASSYGEVEVTSYALPSGPAPTYAAKLLSSPSPLPSSAAAAATAAAASACQGGIAASLGAAAAPAEKVTASGSHHVSDASTAAHIASLTETLKLESESETQRKSGDAAADLEERRRGNEVPVEDAGTAGRCRSGDPVNAALSRLNSKLRTVRSLPSGHRRASRSGGRFSREGEGEVAQCFLPSSPSSLTPSPLTSSPLSSASTSRRASVSPEGRPAGAGEKEAAASGSQRENHAKPGLSPIIQSSRDGSASDNYVTNGPVSPPSGEVNRVTATATTSSSRAEGSRHGRRSKGAINQEGSSSSHNAHGFMATNKHAGGQAGKGCCRTADLPLLSISALPPAATTAAAAATTAATAPAASAATAATAAATAGAAGAAPQTPPGSPSNPLYKTEMCRSWEETGGCRYGAKCQFAHGSWELRPVVRHPKYKTEVSRAAAQAVVRMELLIFLKSFLPSYDACYLHRHFT